MVTQPLNLLRFCGYEVPPSLLPTASQLFATAIQTIYELQSTLPAPAGIDAQNLSLMSTVSLTPYLHFGSMPRHGRLSRGCHTCKKRKIVVPTVYLRQ